MNFNKEQFKKDYKLSIELVIKTSNDVRNYYDVNGAYKTNEARRLEGVNQNAKNKSGIFYDFIVNYFVDEIKIKRGENKFLFNGVEYVIERKEIQENLGWKTVTRLDWNVVGEGEINGLFSDTKKDLLMFINNKERLRILKSFK